MVTEEGVEARISDHCTCCYYPKSGASDALECCWSRHPWFTWGHATTTTSRPYWRIRWAAALDCWAFSSHWSNNDGLLLLLRNIGPSTTNSTPSPFQQIQLLHIGSCGDSGIHKHLNLLELCTQPHHPMTIFTVIKNLFGYWIQVLLLYD